MTIDLMDRQMHCVKVDNVINEFQMLANSQFVENRVYDEEMEDIVTNGPNLENDESVNNKSKEEEILAKIKVALNIGLDFLNQRFDCVSNKVSQNDSDDENDEILEGLISDSARDEYSQRLLPYIIGSEDFIKDNYVGLSCIEESPVIDLKTRINTDLSVKSVDSFESKSETFEVKNITNSNNFIDDMNDSEDESNDLFGTIPKTQESNDLFGTIPQIKENNERSASSSDESDSDPFVSEVKESHKPENTSDSNQWKPSMPSFHDELSAAISAKNPNKNPLNDKKEEIESESAVNNPTKRAPSFGSEESGDENDFMFKVTKTKPKSENKAKNFSNLFGEETNEDSLFAPISQKESAVEQKNKVSPNPKTIKIVEKTSNLFDDDDDEDDLFGAINKKTSKPMKPVLSESPTEKRVSNSFLGSDSNKKKPLVSKTSLFSDDEEEDDLFSAITSKSKPNDVQNSDAFESIVNSNVSPMKVSKPTDSFISELSSALKNKKLFQSDDEESDSSEDNFKVNNDSKIKNENNSETRAEEKNTLNVIESEETNDTLFGDNTIITEKKSSEIKTNDALITKPSNKTNFSNEFYSEEPTLTLSNDGLKHRAALGAQRSRRPPTKKLLKLTPITDFDQNSETKEEIISNIEEKTPPVAAIRTVKTIISNPLSDEMTENQNEIKLDQSNDKTFKSMSALIKSPSTEEDDIFPTQTNSAKNPNVSKLFERSENPTLPLFDDSGDNEDSLFSSNKTIRNVPKKTVDNSRGLFDTSDSDDDNFFSNKSSNVISNIIKPSNSEIFNDVSSTDSSLSNKSEVKIGNSKPAVSLFSDSEDDDLFSAVAKSKSIDKLPEKQTINRIEERKEKTEKSPEKLKKQNSLFSDNEEENRDLFEKKEIKTSKTKPIFDLEDDEGMSSYPS